MEVKMIFGKISMKVVKCRSWKTLKSHRKARGKSWIFKSPNEYEPCLTLLLILSNDHNIKGFNMHLE